MAKPKGASKIKVTPMMVSEVMKEMGRKGGSRKVPKGISKLSKKARSKRAREGAAARWAKVKAKVMAEKAE